MMTSTLPPHGALASFANQIAERHQHVSFINERWRAYEPVVAGDAKCPACRILRNKASNLEAVQDDDPANSRRYVCEVCGQEFRVGV